MLFQIVRLLKKLSRYFEFWEKNFVEDTFSCSLFICEIDYEMDFLHINCLQQRPQFCRNLPGFE